MIRKVIPLLGVLALAGACTDALPTDPRVTPQEASYDGGTLGGSGNKETPPPPPAEATNTTSADSTNRGGTLGGSGN